MISWFLVFGCGLLVGLVLFDQVEEHTIKKETPKTNKATMKKIILITLALFSLLTTGRGEEQSPNQTLIDKALEQVNAGNLRGALEMYLGVAENLKTEKDLGIHVNVYNDLGVVYRRLNMNDSAIYYYNKAFDTAVKLDDKEWLTALSLNLSVFYHNLNHFKDAERYSDMTLKYVTEQEDESLVFYAYQLASNMKTEVKKYDEALRYARKAWAMADGSEGNDDLRLRCIPPLTSVFDAKGLTDSVFHYINIGSRILPRCDNEVTRLGFLQCRSEIYIRHKRWREALPDLRLLADAGGRGTLNSSLYHKMAVCYRHTGDYSRAYCYMDTARMWTDSLSKKDIESKLEEFNVKYETRDKEAQLAEARSEHAVQRAQWLASILLAVFVVAVLVIVLIIVRHRHRLHLMFVRQCAEMNEARQYIEGLETERARMARELHDGVANGLLGVSLKMRGAESPNEVSAILADIDRLRNEVRALSHGMMPPELKNHTLNEILSSYVSNFKDAKIQYSGSDDERWKTMDRDVALEVFRIAQESISNAVAHSEADTIDVSLHIAEDSGEGVMKVEDNGRQPDRQSDGDGIGFRVMQERVKTIGGRIDIRKSQNGTVITLFFPV